MTSRSLPSRIGRYEVVDRLGAGGMGVLYLARDPLLRRTLAIKVLAVDDEDLRERFGREARSAAALSHTNIVTIFDVGEDAGHPFLAMEYLDGETMAEMVRRKAPVALQRRLQLLLELCAGLGYAHRLGIIHRDIKPANLMITGNGTLKILDFGLARLTHDHASGLTQSGALLGTPHYMSPEQIEGRPVDHRSDIFSVGLVLHELLTYKKAFSGEGMHVVLHKITHERPQPLREVDPTLDPALERIVDKATERDPDRRYQSLEMMAADTTAFLKALAGRPDADATVIIRRDHLSEPSSRKPESSSGGKTPSVTPRVPNFEGIARRREAQIQLHLDEAMRHFTEGQFDQAIEQCELAAVLNPEEPRVFDLLSRAHGALDDQQIAAWLAEARARLAEGAFTSAEALVQQSLERRPALPEAQALRREIADARQEQQQIRERQRAVAHAVERAQAHMAAGALDAVVRAANEALAFEPDHAAAQSLKQQALETLDAQRRELEHEQRASSAVAAAKVAVRTGDLDGAAALLDAFAPPHPIVTAARAEVERQIEARRKSIQQAAAAKNAARAAITAGDWASAGASLKQAASFVSADPEIVALQRQLTDARTAAEEAARAAAERERLAREQAEREAREKAERETREKAERERLAREEADRKAREKAEQDARAKAERDAREQAERERLAREEADRKAREKAEQDARAKAEREAREQAERERLVREATDRKAREKAEQDARAKAEREAREKAERERLAREEADRKAREKAEQTAREKAERETRERRAREETERLAREEADRERLAVEAAERNARETSEREARARAEQEALEKAELESVDRAAREQRAREEALALSPDDETRPAGDRTSPRAVALEAARQEALQRSAAHHADTRADTRQAQLPPAKPIPAPRPARPAAAFPMKWAAAILIAGLVVSVAAFLIFGPRRSGTKNATAPSTPQSATVSPADVLREVHRLANEGHPDRSLDAAVKGYRATHDQVLAEYITSARTAAAKTASDAAGEASGTDAAKRAEYTDAAAKFQQAAALKSLEDAPRAIALYADAEKGYRAAVTASTNDPAVFVQKAADAYKNGAVDRAVEYALTARRLDPSHAASDKLIDQIRRDASRETARARSAAVAAGAAGTDDFGRAEKRARDASRTTSPDDLLAQVTANKEAVQLYRASATAVENVRTARHQTAEQHAEQARLLISQKRLDDAENELRQAKTAEPDNATAQAVDRQLADARRAAKAEDLNTRVTALLQQSRGADARQAIALLQQASALDPSRDDVKRELQRRNDELNARPAPPVPVPNPPAPPKDTGSAARAAHDADVAAILQVLERYWAAWDALDVDAIRAVYPSANARSLRDYFKNLKSQQTKVQPQTPEIDSSGTAATVRCRVTSHAEMRAGTVPDSTKNAVLSLAKVGGSWRIIGLQYL
ncbi:MAG TPA: protein kinase [Vicinamibacterales bacterium]|nr:protein kinase [Vicinamibacterales bacterium]